jgi:LytR cell envelope-related transcriptional attenuator
MSFARVRALVVVGVLAVAAVVFVVVALVRDSQRGAVAGAGCPAGSVLADVQLPDGPEQVTVRVLNGTSTAGLAERVTEDFKNRRFRTLKPAADKKRLDGVAEMRYGPAAVGSAHLLLAYFLGDAKMSYSAKRKGAVVDIVIGANYKQLATTTEVNQSLVELGEPTAPPGSCPAPPKKAAGQ